MVTIPNPQALQLCGGGQTLRPLPARPAVPQEAEKRKRAQAKAAPSGQPPPKEREPLPPASAAPSAKAKAPPKASGAKPQEKKKQAQQALVDPSAQVWFYRDPAVRGRGQGSRGCAPLAVACLAAWQPPEGI